MFLSKILFVPNNVIVNYEIVKANHKFDEVADCYCNVIIIWAFHGEHVVDELDREVAILVPLFENSVIKI